MPTFTTRSGVMSVRRRSGSRWLQFRLVRRIGRQRFARFGGQVSPRQECRGERRWREDGGSAVRDHGTRVRGHAVGFFLCVLRVSASRRFQKKLPVDFTCIVPAKSSRKPPATAQIPVAREEQTERPQKRSAIPEAVQPGRGRGGYLVGFQPGEHLAEFFRRHDASAASLRERALGFADR